MKKHNEVIREKNKIYVISCSEKLRLIKEIAFNFKALHSRRVIKLVQSLLEIV